MLYIHWKETFSTAISEIYKKKRAPLACISQKSTKKALSLAL
jgi:hypothetical protein